MQKLRRIFAALSDSLSNEVGQKASAPNLLEDLLTESPIFWNHEWLFCLDCCHEVDEDAILAEI